MKELEEMSTTEQEELLNKLLELRSKRESRTELPTLKASFLKPNGKNWDYEAISEAMDGADIDTVKRLVKDNRNYTIRNVPKEKCDARMLSSVQVAKDSHLFETRTNSGQLAYGRCKNYFQKLVHNQFIVAKERKREEGDGEGGEAMEIYYSVTLAGAKVLPLDKGPIRYTDVRPAFEFPEIEPATEEVRASVVKSLCARHVYYSIYNNRALNYKLIQLEILLSFELWVDVAALKLPTAKAVAV